MICREAKIKNVVLRAMVLNNVRIGIELLSY